ncbi:uncharacterized protein CDAR_367631 [Caerostris darwini]|uniref:BTB domain-containing protein n=1 Tax=Caerostris darwini TaxID=1538125 RepID=A0AAV4SXC6_9ARAC|nr:uncharacterized protein CDAR_367631 [Caerostris darwini]
MRSGGAGSPIDPGVLGPFCQVGGKREREKMRGFEEGNGETGPHVCFQTPMSSNRSGCSSEVTSSRSQIPAASSRHARLLRQFNEDIFKRHVLTDVEVVVEDQVFKSHRAVLICFSPSLKRKLISEDGKPIARRVCVPRICSKDFEVLLHYMYTGDLNVNCNNFYEVYKAASILEMQDVIDDCLQLLEPSNDIKVYFYVYAVSKKMDTRTSCQRALKLLTHRFEEAICDFEFLHLDVNSVVELLSAQSIGARSEVLVFLAALRWLNFEYGWRQEHAVRVMECVRFSTMSMDEIIACYHPPYLAQLLNNSEIVMLLFRATCYITAKFLGKEAWFRRFGCTKRKLAFENLPMELWHPKDAVISNMDFALNWQKSISQCGHLDSPVQVKNADSTLFKSSMKTSNSHRLESPHVSERRRYNSETSLSEAVQKIVQQCTQGNGDEVNVKDVVRKVVDEINTQGLADAGQYGTPQKNEGQNFKKHKGKKESKPGLSNTASKKSSETKNRDQFPIMQKSARFSISDDLQMNLGTQNHKNSNKSFSEIPLKTIDKLTQTSCEMDVKECEKRHINDENLDTSLTMEPFYFATSKQIPNQHSWQERETAIKEQPIRQHHSLDNGDRAHNKNSKKQNSSLLDNYEEEYSSSVELSPEPSAEFSKETPTILVIGGMNPKNLHTIGVGGAVLNYNPKQDKWVKYSTVPAPRHNHSAVFYNECLYIIGGCNPLETLQQNGYIAKRSCYKLDTSTQKWSSLQDMKFKRYDHGLVVFDGQIYALGGQDDEERLLKNVEVYDIKKNKWKVLSSEMCCGRKAMGVAVFSNKIWMAGGLMQPDKEVTFQVVSYVDYYDPKQKRWSSNVYSLPEPRCYCNLVVWTNRLYCIGGMVKKPRDKMSPTDQVWFFNSKTEKWEDGPTLPVARMGCVALVYDSDLYVVGGFDPESDIAIRNVNHLAPGAISWQVSAPLPSHLFGIAAVSCDAMQ